MVGVERRKKKTFYVFMSNLSKINKAPLNFRKIDEGASIEMILILKIG